MAGRTLPRILRKIGHREWRVTSWGPCYKLLARGPGGRGFWHTYEIGGDNIALRTAVRWTPAERDVVGHFVGGIVATGGERHGACTWPLNGVVSFESSASKAHMSRKLRTAPASSRRSYLILERAIKHMAGGRPCRSDVAYKPHPSSNVRKHMQAAEETPDSAS